jgi:hypothetical protein
MTPPPPESILPPAPKFTLPGFAAVIAIPITIVVVIATWALSFWLVHGAGPVQVAVAAVLVWPGYLLTGLLAERDLPVLLLYVAVIGVEYLYLWGAIIAIMKGVVLFKARRNDAL